VGRRPRGGTIRRRRTNGNAGGASEHLAFGVRVDASTNDRNDSGAAWRKSASAERGGGWNVQATGGERAEKKKGGTRISPRFALPPRSTASDFAALEKYLNFFFRKIAANSQPGDKKRHFCIRVCTAVHIVSRSQCRKSQTNGDLIRTDYRVVPLKCVVSAGTCLVGREVGGTQTGRISIRVYCTGRSRYLALPSLP
jgi:hypothetical protein